MIIVESRKDFGKYCNYLGLQSFAVEVGTDLGRFAKHFLSTWKGACLFCIDPWQTDLVDYREKRWDRFPDLLCTTLALSEFMLEGRCRLVKSVDSCEVRETLKCIIGSGTFDFVYIDGNHQYVHVKQDIGIWWPVIKPGGILAGHDYSPNTGVVKAVNEFCQKENLKRTVLQCSSWFVRKPGEKVET